MFMMYAQGDKIKILVKTNCDGEDYYNNQWKRITEFLIQDKEKTEESQMVLARLEHQYPPSTYWFL